MTRGGLSIDQKMVDRFVDENITSFADFGNLLKLNELGFEDITLDFEKMRELFSRGLCLDLQRRERGSSTIKIADIKGAMNSADPLEYLKSKGYDSKVLAKLAK